MRRQFIFAPFALFAAAASAFAQAQVPTREELTRSVQERNRAVNDPANNPFNRAAASAPTGRMTGVGRPSGAETRKYVTALQAETQVKVLSVNDGDTFIVDDGKNKTRVHILGIDAPELAQPGGEDAKKNLSALLLGGKRIVLKYSLNNLTNAEGLFLARVFAGGNDVGLDMIKNGFAWRDERDRYFLEKETDNEHARAEVEAKAARRGIWQNEKPQKPREYKSRMAKKKAAGK